MSARAQLPSAADTPLVRLEGVGRRFGDRWVLEDVSLELRPGELLGIVGPGGHGKSVLLKLVAGLEQPDRGRVLIDGRDLRERSPGELRGLRDEMGYLFQNYALFDFMNVGDNVAFPLRRQARLEEPAIAERVQRLLDHVGLGHALANYPRELSGGMKKRVGLARAVVAEPRIALYDDPTAGLDPVTSSKIFEMLAALHRDAVSHEPRSGGLVVSHDVDRMRAVCDRYVLLADGGVRFDGTLSEALAEGGPGRDPRVGVFFADSGLGIGTDASEARPEAVAR